MQVLMVCLGNICRSPTAEAVFRNRIENKNMQDQIQVDSAGTGDYHIGEAPDARSLAAAARRGYSLAGQRARQVQDTDFRRFDYILAMDRNNLKELKQRCPSAQLAKLKLLLDFGQSGHDAVPDPYYSGPAGFDLVLDLVEAASDGLLEHILKTHFESSQTS
ncbi:MAG: low molecular weight protein-tyrosine-phosphatase [Gammaproteobacteria bacterium]